MPHRPQAFLAAWLVFLAATAAAAPPPVEVETVEGHTPPDAGAHPRLLVRGAEGVEALRAAAETEWGKRVTARTRQALKLVEKLAITGRNREVIKEAGFKAAGYGALHLLAQEAPPAAHAKRIVLAEIVAYPMVRSIDLMDRVSRLHGAALAYDLCYDAWDGPSRAKVRAWLRAEAERLRAKVGPPDAPKVGQPEHVTAYAAAGLAEMACLGDDDEAGARKRIDASERAVVAYLERNVGEFAFDAHGESVREAAYGSGILEFVRALRSVLGRDLTGHPSVALAIVPMIYQSVPQVGIAVTGEPTATVDRTGLFALATALTPPARQGAVGWLFDKVGGGQYLGIVRPHHGLAMLTSGMDAIEPVAPEGDAWPRFVRSDRARFVVFRSRWKDSDDVATVLHDAILRIVGPAAAWVSEPGLHAGMWSHDPGAGRLDGGFLFKTNLEKKSTAYDLRFERRLLGAEADDAGDRASLAFALKGEVKARGKTYTVTERDKDNKKVERKMPIPPGGTFEGRRVLGVDYSTRCGAPAMFVLADRIEGGGEAPRLWILHAGPQVTITHEPGSFTLTHESGTTLHATVVYPKDLEFEASSNGAFANFLTARTESDRVEVVMTIQPKGAPKVKATEKGLAGKVKVGTCTVRLDGDAIVFED